VIKLFDAADDRKLSFEDRKSGPRALPNGCRFLTHLGQTSGGKGRQLSIPKGPPDDEQAKIAGGNTALVHNLTWQGSPSLLEEPTSASVARIEVWIIQSL
jgi:hypothetical protein